MNMKKYINTISAALLILCFASSCVDLNMNPPSEASSENWYKNADQITMSLNDLYRKAFYGMESEYWTDSLLLYDFLVGSAHVVGFFDSD